MTDGSVPRDVTLAEFKDSFYYGERSDLNVTFLADLTADDAGTFFADELRDRMQDRNVGSVLVTKPSGRLIGVYRRQP